MPSERVGGGVTVVMPMIWVIDDICLRQHRTLHTLSSSFIRRRSTPEVSRKLTLYPPHPPNRLGNFPCFKAGVRFCACLPVRC